MKLFRKKKQLQSFTYKGFLITILNNCYYSFKFEYNIQAITNSNKHILKKLIKPNRKFINQKFDTVFDVTSHKYLKVAVMIAKRDINNILYRASSVVLKYVE